jgi:hypothetical protein
LQTVLGNVATSHAHRVTTAAGALDQASCWCCGTVRGPEDLVRLGAHPEVAVCLRCAHTLHHRAQAREDEQRPSVGARARDVLRAGRGMVVRRGWHRMPVVGPVLRRLGPRLP